MKIIDKKIIKLNDGTRDLNVLVYLKEVNVRNDGICSRPFCRVLKKKKLMYMEFHPL